MSRLTQLLQVIGLLFVLLFFFVSLELMGSSFKLMGRGFAEALLTTTANPFVGLFIGILATSLVQSSSTVTALTVAIVAGGGLTVAGAVPIIMGANIGTSVTNTIVALGHITRPDEFRRAIAGATVHDFFNLLVVSILFPLELTTGLISGTAGVLSGAITGVGGTDLLSPVKLVTKPVTAFIINLVNENGIVVLILGLIGLFVALRYLVVLLKALVLGRSEKVLHKYIFGQPLISLLAGTALTVLVQSSSITTSMIVPLVGAGIVTVAQIFPFVLGANIGTTITAIIAGLALAAGADVAGAAALQVAFAHFAFNLYGVLLVMPVKQIRNLPVRMAEALGNLAVKNRAFALIYIALVFFVIPLLIIIATRGIDGSFYEVEESSHRIEHVAPPRAEPPEAMLLRLPGRG